MMSETLRRNIAAAQQQQLAHQQQDLAGNIRRANENPASVAGCQASPWQPSPDYGTGQYGSQWGPNNPMNPSMGPQSAPQVPPSQQVGPNQVLAQNASPLGVNIQANAPAGTPTTVLISPATGLYYINCVRTFNQPGEITINRVTSAGLDVPRNSGSFDAAAYNTLECCCPVDWGCISSQAPMTLTFASQGSPSTAPFLNMVLFGTWQQSFNSCYPGIGPAVGLAQM